MDARHNTDQHADELNLELRGKDKTVVNMLNKCFQTKNGTSVLKAAATWFWEVPKPHVRAEDATEGLFTNWQRVLHRADWQLSDKHFEDFVLLEPVATFMCCPFREMFKSIGSNQKYQRCFTWTRLEWRMRLYHYELTFSRSPGFTSSCGTWGNVALRAACKVVSIICFFFYELIYA